MQHCSYLGCPLGQKSFKENRWYFGRNDNTKRTFRNQLTFNNKTEISEKKEAVPEKVETSEVENAGDDSDPEISAQLAKIDELMDHSSEAIQTKQEQTSPDKIEPVVVETTTVEEKEADETDIQVHTYILHKY